MYFCKSVSCIVAYRFVNGALEYCLYGSTRAMMHSVSELEVAKGKFRVVDMYIQSVQLRLIDLVVLPYLSVQALQRFEVLALVCVVKRLTKVEIAKLFTLRLRYPGKEQQSRR